MAPQRWTREQQLVALRLYLTEPFGRLHQQNPIIKGLSKLIGRTPSALAMKACNFASLDPTFRKSGRKGLEGASESDRSIWSEFARLDAREQLIDLVEPIVEPVLNETRRPQPQGDDEAIATVKVRRHQRFFREETMASYGGVCALSGLDIPSLLVASHIIPWAKSKERRIDPRNGVLLNALLDRAFDRGFIGFDDELRVVVSRRLRGGRNGSRDALIGYEGRALSQPERTPPDLEAIRWHRRQWELDAA